MNSSHIPLLNKEIGRRALLGGALGFTALGALAACAGPEAASTAGGVAGRGGSFRVGYVGGSGAEVIDPTLVSGTPDIIRMRQLFDTLTKATPTGEFVPWLAEEVTQEDPSTWVIRLREGITFHNGKDMTADDVIASLQRAAAPESPNAGALHMLDPNGLVKLDGRTVRMNLNKPTYYMNEAFQAPAISIVPVDFDPAAPVGSGPFSLKSFTPGQQVVFERFDNYFEEAALVDEIVLSTFSDESARTTALQGGQLDSAPMLAASYAAVVEASGTMKINQYPTGRFENFILNCASDEFRDPRVREAMRLLIDRQQLLDQAYGGAGRIGNDIPEPSSVNYNHQAPQWEVDVAEAKSLLKSAGAENLQLELITAPLSTTLVGAAEVFVQQLVEAGLDARITQIDAGAFYGPGFGERPFSQDTWGGWTFATFTDLAQLPTSVFNESSWDNQEFMSAYNAASDTMDAATREQHLMDAQQIMHDDSGTLIPVFIDILDVYAANVTGYGTEVLGIGGGNFDYRHIGFTS